MLLGKLSTSQVGLRENTAVRPRVPQIGFIGINQIIILLECEPRPAAHTHKP